MKFKSFLEFLTPMEYKAKQAELRREANALRKGAWVSGREAEINGKVDAELVHVAAMIPDAYAEALKKGKKLGKKEEEMLKQKSEDRKVEIERRRKLLLKKHHPGQEVLDAEYAEVLAIEPDNEEDELYFKEPSDLLDIFGNLEESNLFLIQNSQEREEAMEETAIKFAKTKEEMEARTLSLKESIKELERGIALKKAKCDHAVADIEAARLGKTSSGAVEEEEEGEMDKKASPAKKEVKAHEGEDEEEEVSIGFRTEKFF